MNPIISILTRLNRHPMVALLLLACYFPLVVFPHNLIGEWLERNLDLPLGRERYNGLVSALALLVAGTYLVLFYHGWKRGIGKRPGTAGVFLILLVGSLAAMRWLVVIRVEMVHFVQYAILAAWVFVLLPRHGPTFLTCLFAACLDEGWQHFVLSVDKSAYFDFNDLLLDSLGTGWALVWIRTTDVPWILRTRFPYRWPVGAWLLLLSLTAAAYLAGALHHHDPANAETLRWSLVRQPWAGWWQTVHPNVTFHILGATEGILWLTGLFLVVRTLDNHPPPATDGAG